MALSTSAPASSSGSSTTGGSSLAHLLPPTWRSVIQDWLRDDAPTFDIGGFVVGESEETAVLLAKTRTTLAGVPFFTEVFTALGCTIEWLAAEGDILEPPARVAYVRGKCRHILLGERTALNILSRASGVATLAHAFSSRARAAGWHGEVAGTRKVTPGFRLVEKYALLVGGCSTHRMDLSQMTMLKDNHVHACGSITAAVKAARRAAGFSTKIEVEARNLAEAEEAAAAGADIVMLDNYTPEGLKADAAALKAKYPHVITEASGGINLETVASYFSPHVDVVSVGGLTHGYAVADFSLKILKGHGLAMVVATEDKLKAAASAASAVTGAATASAGAPAAAGGAGAAAAEGKE